jgi:hypothetical protein
MQMIQKLRPRRSWLWLYLGLVALASLILAGCSKGEARTGTNPTHTPTTVAAEQTPQITPTPTTKPTAGPTKSLATTPTPTTLDPNELPLTLLAPQDGMGIEIDSVRIIGTTRPDAAVGVNGTPVEISATGMFQHDVSLDDGINGIQIEAADLSGSTASEYAVVFFISPTAGLPLSVFYPYDGLQVDESEVQVVGGTRQDAVVGVNGYPVEVDANGIFSTTVSLEEGANLIEVVAADVDQNVRFQTVSVFYIP